MSAHYLELLQVHSPETENPYFRLWLQLHAPDWNPGCPGNNVFQMLKVWEKSPEIMCERARLVGRYSWAVPCSGTLDFICKQAAGRQIVEVGAGNGYWAQLLSSMGELPGGQVSCRSICVSCPGAQVSTWWLWMMAVRDSQTRTPWWTSCEQMALST